MTVRLAKTPSSAAGANARAGEAAASASIEGQALPASSREEAEAINRQGEAALAAHDALQALADFDRALALRPDFALAAHNRALALRDLGRVHEAIDWQSRALALQPGLAAAYAERAACAQDIGDSQAALLDLEAALALDPSRASWHVAQAMLLADLGGTQEARAAFARAMANGADRDAVQFLLCAADGSPPPPTTPSAYVAALFDAYAPRFERHLMRRLKYRAPQLLADALLPLLPPRKQAMVDLGCGTGLMGALLRQYASRLDGVDVSSAMIEQARARNVYDALHVGELGDFLRASPARYDAIAAADVFVYIGDLQPVFAAAAGALRRAGLLAFTVEALDEGDYVLQPTRRYAHARGYIERTAHAHGFAPRGITRRTLRRNGDVEVQGYVAVFAALNINEWSRLG